MPLVSSISGWSLARFKGSSSAVLAGLTQRRMLERKGNNILDPLEWVRRRIPRESLADDDLDTSQVIAGVPVVLV